ncbi:hypothetical protein HRM2_05960 [Desulforapulum autotrophicum HRM2]|uniref:Uncharacterized protein n=1 Tax=Desulforapulum autotrophicum (strain ATCC 43914 / DSM 3382 / VKM B-1955 / HRM2) TaxID=177437 RepID=C0QIS0_DESAH|nr:hypothetical protein HRM2_05960 [Desulforapulum autotrophicum HRM2]
MNSPDNIMDYVNFFHGLFKLFFVNRQTENSMRAALAKKGCHHQDAVKFIFSV